MKNAVFKYFFAYEKTCLSLSKDLKNAFKNAKISPILIDLARPWVRGALKKNLIQELAENGEKEG